MKLIKKKKKALFSNTVIILPRDVAFIRSWQMFEKRVNNLDFIKMSSDVAACVSASGSSSQAVKK